MSGNGIDKLDRTLSRLLWLRDDHKDVIPTKSVHSCPGPGEREEDHDRMYKVTKIWFQGVINEVGVAGVYGLLPEDVKLIALNFERYVEESKFRDRKTNREDIRKGNFVLNSAIRSLRQYKEYLEETLG